MKKVIVSFYHCPVTMNAIEQDLGSMNYSKIETEYQQEIVLTSLFSNYFNLYLKVGEEITSEDTVKYFDRQTGKLYGFITEQDSARMRTAGIISKAQFQRLDERYNARNITKIIA